MRLSYLAIVALLASAGLGIQQSAEAQLPGGMPDLSKQIEAAKAAAAAAQGQASSPGPSNDGIAPSGSQTAHHVLHAVKIEIPRWECDVNWNETCDDEAVIEADEHMQVCKVVFRRTTHDGWDKEFTFQPASSYPRDPEEPDRFRAVVVKIRARGNMKFWDQHGSKEVVEDIGIDMIPADANNEARYLAGCWMPQT
jgi:hypothetical protein